MKKILLILLLYVTCAFLVFAIEMTLRVSGFSYIPPDAGFQITPEYKIFDIEGDNYRTKKDKIGVFLDQSFPVSKSKNEIRIFIFGGSSVYNLGNAGILQEKLKNIAGDKVIRIINIGGNSYGTSRLLLSFQEVLGYEPDIMVLYSGHNEFEEKFIEEIAARNGPLRQLNDLLIEHSRIYQFLCYGINKTTAVALQKVVDLNKAGKIPFFPNNIKNRVSWNIDFDKDAKNYIYQRYNNNILQMIFLARKKHIKMAISTVAYNRLNEPFKKKGADFEKGIELYNKGKYNEALNLLEVGLDADLRPHRASRTTNSIIKKISKNTKTPLVDVDSAVCLAAGHGIPGKDIFAKNDHCHLNEKGNSILQEMIFQTIKDNKMLE
ncbi:MAG: SGNH/GDSL hydrolase family protein [Elusimicrobia bacterium]|nr:SGNH/GDSL hydrolase family protein [Candidatus Liberimonas magnetica]